ncbi:hypothetical protein ACIBO1_26825 [Micromonospora sp. NPDC049903]|uniref:hypothetical protein n=1 Tax=Micromonospora sp. NPDC049903 TaxID=3364276 RepID=UPI003791C77E
MSSGYDPVLAEQSVRKLAAVTDEQLIDEVRAATAVVVDRVEHLRRTGWPRDPVEQAASAAMKDARTALVGLSAADASLAAVVTAVRPVLGQWWPGQPAEAAAVAAAVERLRYAALHRPAQVRDARWLSTP